MKSPEDAARADLAMLERVHRQRLRLQRHEDVLTERLAASHVRNVRTEMARILGVRTETLRLRYGSVPYLKSSHKK